MGRSQIQLPVDWSKAASDRPREHHGKTLTGRVMLDGATFESCTFRNAVLIYAGGPPPRISGCSFDETVFEFQGAAGRTLAMLQAMAAPTSGLSTVFKASFSRLFGH